MKRILTIVTVAALAACGQPANEETPDNTTDTTDTEAMVKEVTEPETGNFGAEITEDGAITPTDLLAQIGDQETMDAKMEATINECCQKKGCWMMVDMENGEEMRVTFKDYEFFVPLTAGGKTAIMEGKAYYDTVSVEMLQHYAEDAGKPQEEIDAITEPEMQLAFEATGVIIKE